MTQENTTGTLEEKVDHVLGDSFGNYMLHGIDEVQLPDAISWWPQTYGWKILAVLLLLWLCKIVYQQALKWRRNRYRREALKQLNRLQACSESIPSNVNKLPALLKATALQAYPRSEVAQLSGSAWLKMLDTKYGSSLFTNSIGEQMLVIAYQPQENWQVDRDQYQTLIELTRRWIKGHKSDDKAISRTIL